MTKDYERLNEAGKEFLNGFIEKVMMKNPEYRNDVTAEEKKKIAEAKKQSEVNSEKEKIYQEDCDRFFDKIQSESMGWEREQYLEMLFPLFECMSMDKVRYFYIFIAGKLHCGSKRNELGLK